ncbi:hypothetical protein [Streptomyces sp. SM11]|nr:hypothetical protein [Streptomyces sp. SM11]
MAGSHRCRLEALRLSVALALIGTFERKFAVTTSRIALMPLAPARSR